MIKTQYARKIDSMGRIIIPPHLREECGINIGETYEFCKCETEGKVYLCIECVNAESEVEKAKKILAAAGIKTE